MVGVFFNIPSGKYVVRLGELPVHLGGLGSVGIRPRLLTDESGKIKFFDTYDDALLALTEVM